MNRATKIALDNLNNSPFHLRTALFHSTPVLDRRRRTHWESAGSFYRSSSRRPNFNSRRQRKFYAKQELLRNANAFTENLFQGWRDFDEFDPSSSHGSSSFKGFNMSGGFNGNRASKGPRATGRRKGYQFHEDVEEVETIFRSAFGGNGFYFWSFINDEPPRSSSGFHSNHRTSRSWRHRLEDEDEDEDEFSSESDRVETNLTKDRMTLGLSGSGPLSLDDVKNAYRVCALKWHPDRHEGSSKAIAEEKFKVCSAAYQSLCDKLALN
ncbi:uncharacterized protein LOC112511970 isoform X1 [Cynara cardunculus var. scolymus]|uniref:DnaJ domain-containing protein n=1 Tax=Cynara cardunculus var. scolymus TaxID=59895 RepID=A0A118K1Y0_CYNCS|nr:uncharacterized protein LOC112511970 isoform X1 [Cynara cardunculus var. scolymus]XP_024973497.1 uncharacterized protein LOC112511970 isoform X1 [Cynara cardunculus var. scolymus]KVI03512.1 DnaJ domain-containing protein [Cynara cardunculus var. scolymus]